jgi:hypothetical protein
MKVFARLSRAPALIVIAVCALMAGGVYAATLPKQPSPTGTPIVTAPAPTKATVTPVAAPSAASETATAPTPVESKPAATTAAKPRPVTPAAGPLSSITITEGADSLVRFKSAGKSPSGYLLIWKLSSQPAPNQATSGVIAANHSLYQLDKGQDVWTGSAGVFELKFAMGSYELRICQNVNGACGSMSNVIYLDITAITECTVQEYTLQNLCLIKGSKLTYHF